MLNENDIVGAAHNYTFVKWMKDGGLLFRINPKQRKKNLARL